LHKPDEVFGELLLAEENRPFTAIAIRVSLVTVISKESFVELLSAVPTFASNFIRLLSKRLATVERVRSYLVLPRGSPGPDHQPENLLTHRTRRVGRQLR
jgi:CRP-like cAMP-binding protein